MSEGDTKMDWYWGVCPHCRERGVGVDVGAQEWSVCEGCRVRWTTYVFSLSSPTRGRWAEPLPCWIEAVEQYGDYEEVEPFYPQPPASEIVAGLLGELGAVE